MDEPKHPKTSEPFKAGDSIFHQMLGNGRVIDTDYPNDTPRMYIEFEEEGKKWLVPKYANLRPRDRVTSTSIESDIGRSLKDVETRIVGVAHYEGGNRHSPIQSGEPLTLRREPNNSHDANAIEVFWYGKKLGYVPRRYDAALSELMDNHKVIKTPVTAVDYHSPWEPVEFDVGV